MRAATRSDAQLPRAALEKCVATRDRDFFLNYCSTSRSQAAGKVFGELAFLSAEEQPS